MSQTRLVEVAPARVSGWLDGFQERHGAARASVGDGALELRAADGSTCRARSLMPFVPLVPSGALPAREARPSEELIRDFVAHVQVPHPVVMLLLRRGGYAVGLTDGDRMIASKVGTRYVQSRTAAGGWSQQRFARRRDNQAGQLVAAAATSVIRIVMGADGQGPRPRLVVVTGGDRAMIARLLDDPRLAVLTTLPRPRHLDVPDPRSDVLRAAVPRSVAVRIDVLNA